MIDKISFWTNSSSRISKDSSRKEQQSSQSENHSAHSEKEQEDQVQKEEVFTYQVMAKMVEDLNAHEYYQAKELFFELEFSELAPQESLVIVRAREGKKVQTLPLAALRSLHQRVIKKPEGSIKGGLLNLVC